MTYVGKVKSERWRTQWNATKQNQIFRFLAPACRRDGVNFNLMVVSRFQLFFSMYPDRDNPWTMLAVSSTDSFCILSCCITTLILKIAWIHHQGNPPGPHTHKTRGEALESVTFFPQRPRLTAMNLTDFRDNALLKLQVGGPFAGGMVDLTDQEYVLIQVEQTEQPGQRRRRSQQVGVSARHRGWGGWGGDGGVAEGETDGCGVSVNRWSTTGPSLCTASAATRCC